MKTIHNIPYHRGKGLLGLEQAFIDNNAKFVHEKEAELGDFYRLKIPTFPLYITFRPSIIQHVLQTNAKNYRKSPAYDQLKLGLGSGLVTSEGLFWKRQRKMIQPAFYKAKLEALFQKMTIAVDTFIEDLKSQLDQSKVLDVAELMTQITADIVLQTLFSSTNKTKEEQLFQLMHDMQAYVIWRVNHPFGIPFLYLNGRHRQFKKGRAIFAKQLSELIEERRQMQQRPADLLTMLLEATDAETSKKMTDEQVKDEAITIFSAGHETSSNGMAWTLYLLAQHPVIVEKLRKEEKAILDGRTPNFDDLRRLTYHRQVIEEGMRLFPPAHVVGRQAIAADEIEGVPIKPNSVFYLSIFALHRSPKYWEQPLLFDPDRFATDELRKKHKRVYLPFGAGARMCIGNHFAMMEMQLILARWVRQFDFENVSADRKEYIALITLKPKGGVHQKLKARQ